MCRGGHDVGSNKTPNPGSVCSVIVEWSGDVFNESQGDGAQCPIDTRDI